MVNCERFFLVCCCFIHSLRVLWAQNDSFFFSFQFYLFSSLSKLPHRMLCCFFILFCTIVTNTVQANVCFFYSFIYFDVTSSCHRHCRFRFVLLLFQYFFHVLCKLLVVAAMLFGFGHSSIIACTLASYRKFLMRALLGPKDKSVKFAKIGIVNLSEFGGSRWRL